MEKKALNVPDIAQQLGISRPTAYDLCKQEGFPSITVGKRIIIPVDAFEKWLMDAAANKAEF